jgi:hypothetical protein
LKLTLPFPCQSCGTRDPVDVSLAAPWWEWTCPQCGNQNSVLTGLGMTIGPRLLARAGYEYRAQTDYSMTIVFSAMAMECELARLFKKWMDIESLNRGQAPDDRAIEEAYRRLGSNVADRIEAVAILLDPRGLYEFVKSSKEWNTTITDDFPSLNVGSLARTFNRPSSGPETGFSLPAPPRCAGPPRWAAQKRSPRRVASPRRDDPSWRPVSPCARRGERRPELARLLSPVG